MIFVGGSTDTPDEIVHATCVAIQEGLELRAFAASQSPDGDEDKVEVPVVLFPGGSHALSPAADAITFMMLMNSTDREVILVGEQLRGGEVGSAYMTTNFIDSAMHSYRIYCMPSGWQGGRGWAVADLIIAR